MCTTEHIKPPEELLAAGIMAVRTPVALVVSNISQAHLAIGGKEFETVTICNGFIALLERIRIVKESEN